MAEEIDEHVCGLCGDPVEPPADFVPGLGDDLVCTTCLIDHAEVIAQAEKNLQDEKRKLN